MREIIKSICTAGGPRHRHHHQGTATKAQRDGLAPILGCGGGGSPPKGRGEVGWTPGAAEGPLPHACPSAETPPGTLPNCAGVIEGEKVAPRVPSWMAAGDEPPGAALTSLAALGTRTRPRRAPRGHSSRRDRGGQRSPRLIQKTGQPKAGGHRGCTHRAQPSPFTDTARLGRTLRNFGGNEGLMAGFCFYGNPQKQACSDPKECPQQGGWGVPRVQTT